MSGYRYLCCHGVSETYRNFLGDNNEARLSSGLCLVVGATGKLCPEKACWDGAADQLGGTLIALINDSYKRKGNTSPAHKHTYGQNGFVHPPRLQ